MTRLTLGQHRFRQAFLLFLVIAISAFFYAMIRPFALTILMAAIFSALAQPLYRSFNWCTRGRRYVASAITVLVVLLAIVVPVSGFLGLVVTEAISVSQSVGPWVTEQLNEPNRVDEIVQRLPFSDLILPYRDTILERAGELTGYLGGYVVSSLATTTRVTVTFIFQLFIMLYAMFFFIVDGRRVLDKILYYTPLSSIDKERMIEKFVSVSRATMRGTLVIGIVQGTLAGLAFFVFGINGALFWGTVMGVLSIIPGIGSALIWIPAAIYLVAVGRLGAGLGLTIWCAAVVSTIDNLLRPWLVGRDTQLPDLLILLGTLGGLFLFGALGIIIGPIIAALFVTVWEMYGVAFKDVLNEAEDANGESAG